LGQTIQISRYLIADDVLNVSTLNHLVISDTPIANGIGKFGKVFDCLAINGIQPINLLAIKILSDKEGHSQNSSKFLVRLFERMIALFEREEFRGYKYVTSIPGLKAFPIFYFEGHIDNDFVRGYASYNLIALGYQSFAEFMFDENALFSIAYSDKYKVCHSICEGFSVLNKVSYVHGDVNPVNLFINSEINDLAIIDFDGGNIIETNSDNTFTFGKIIYSEYIALEIFELIASNQEPKIKVTKHCDEWSILMTIHFVLFTCYPHFFLRTQDAKSLNKYTLTNKYFPVNIFNVNVSKDQIEYIEYYENEISKNIPSLITNELFFNFEKSIRLPELRTPASKWSQLFASTQEIPEIDFFKTDKSIILSGTFVKLSWNVLNEVLAVSISSFGIVDSMGELLIQVHKNSIFTLEAIGKYGTSKKIVEVMTAPLPSIPKIEISAPQINFITTNMIHDFKQIKLNTSININLNYRAFIPNIQNSVFVQSQKVSSYKRKFVDKLIQSISDLYKQIVNVF
jgi:serine/threonine protein kinase